MSAAEARDKDKEAVRRNPNDILGIQFNQFNIYSKIQYIVHQ